MHASLGFKFKDRVTGFEGVATGRIEYMTGCNQLLLVPAAKDGEWKDGHWVDEQRCDKVVSFEKITLDNSKSPGFDKAHPRRS